MEAINEILGFLALAVPGGIIIRLIGSTPWGRNFMSDMGGEKDDEDKQDEQSCLS